MREETELTTRGLDPHLIMRLLGYLRPYASWVALAFALIVTGSVVRQAGPYLTKIAVDDYIIPGDAPGLTKVIIAFVGLMIAQFVLGFAEGWITNMVGQWSVRDMRMQIFSHLQRLPVRFFDRTPIGRLMARNTNDVDALNELFTDGAVSLVSNVITVATILGYMFYLDFDLGLLTVLLLPFGAAATWWLQKRTFQAYREARTLFGRFAASLQETITGMEVVQLFRCEDRSARRFDEANDRYLDARLTSTLYHSMYFPFMEFSGLLLMAFVLWYGTGRAIDGNMEWGILVAALQYVPRFFMPIRDAAERYATLQVAMASSERIFEILDTEPESPGSGRTPDRTRGEIEFRNVWFAYDDEDWVLRDLSFTTAAGQSLALVGATGAGKSTVISLLSRFYEIQRGQIFVDGVEVREWDVRELRRWIGVVHQDVFLFNDTVERNIGFFAADMAPAVIRRAAHDANADRFIERLPGGYKYKLGERGVFLSAGQRQLLAFARVLASAPEILVLDEATANIDTETESWIQEALVRLMRTRTSLVIAHRLSTIRNADKILVLHRGQLKEQGSHEELLNKRGFYYRLHQLQFGNADRETGSDGH